MNHIMFCFPFLHIEEQINKYIYIYICVCVFSYIYIYIYTTRMKYKVLYNHLMTSLKEENIGIHQYHKFKNIDHQSAYEINLNMIFNA